MAERISTYAEFWPFYLNEHRQPATRYFHFFGTGLGVILFVLAIVLAEPWLLPVALVSGYAFAWMSHALIEHNRPATFTHPLWSFVSDFRMLWMWLIGRLDSELDLAGVK